MRQAATSVIRWSATPFSWPIPSLNRRLKYYGANLAIYCLAIGFYAATPYYQHALNSQTIHWLIILAAGYTLLAPAFYLTISEAKLAPSRGFAVLAALRRLGLAYFNYFSRRSAARPKWTEAERVSILFFGVKFFFLPMMLGFLIGNLANLHGHLSSLPPLGSLLSRDGFNGVLYPLLLSLFLLIDVAIFSFGYLFESRLLGNRVRSVEPTFLGWAVCLACYDPFNGYLNRLVPWHSDDFASFHSSGLTFGMHLASLIFMGIYVSASVALGTKASNLTNRGIVSSGPYRFVRHPAYTFKNLAWWLGILPVFSVAAVLSMMAWSSVYFLRSITEERHLRRDPDYRAYCQKVKHRFIPGVI